MGVVYAWEAAWVGQIVTFFAYIPPSRPLDYPTPTQPGRVTNPTRGCPGALWEALKCGGVVYYSLASVFIHMRVASY